MLLAPEPRVAVGRGSAYDLFLTRSLKRAQLERVPTSGEVVSAFLQRNFEVAAGVRQQLEVLEKDRAEKARETSRTKDEYSKASAMLATLERLAATLRRKAQTE